jgi:23S rRNA (cytidine1920-2'-O)/16S rRNA (cytidine1409-2'-O)-methyltransferase
LQHGALSVVGVNVGNAQLHPSLPEDPCVLCVERVNFIALAATDLVAFCKQSTSENGQFDQDDGDEEQKISLAEFALEFDVLVTNLSFISQTLVLPAVVLLLKTGGTLLTLVKPQLELQPGQVGKGGIVEDDAMYPLVEQRLRETCTELGLTVTHWFDSPIDAGDGNREFFICVRKPLAIVS